MKYYIDTNVFVRHLAGDDPVKSPRCFEIIKKLSTGELEAETSPLVISEICYVLSSRSLQYKLTPQQIRDGLSPIIALKSLTLHYKELYLNALDVYTTYQGLDFEDAVNVAYMREEGLEDILSYDKDFDQIPHITRWEP